MCNAAYPTLAAVEADIALPEGMKCPREPFAFMGTPCLQHLLCRQGGGDFEGPVMCMFGFVVDPTIQVRLLF